MNGSLNVYIPLLSLPQRGGYQLSLGLVHRSNLHALSQHVDVESTTDTSDGTPIVVDTLTYTDSMPAFSTPLEVNLPRLQFSYEYVGDHPFVSQSGAITFVGNIYCATNFLFTDWQGNAHPFENVSTCNWHLGGPNLPMASLTDASDGSFYRLDTSAQTDLKVYGKDGTVYHFYGFSDLFPDNGTNVDPFSNQENYYDTRAGLIVDPNGNQISIQTTYSNNVANYALTDTLGRTITITPTAVGYDDSNGQPQTISIETNTSSTTTSYDYAPSCHYNGPPQNSPYRTPTVTTSGIYTNLPSSSTVTITFPASAGGGAKQYTLTFDQINRLTKIAYPYGGYTRYDYATYPATQLMGDVYCSYAYPEVSHKYECSSSSGSCQEQTTTYQPTLLSDGVVYNSQMKITDPLGDQEVDIYSTANSTRTNPEETDIKSYNPSGTLIRAIHNTYTTIAPSQGGYANFDLDFPSQVTTTLFDVSPPVSTTTTYQYEAYPALPNLMSGIIDNPIEIDTTDYSGSVIRKVTQQWEPASAFTSSPLILDRLESRTTTDGAGTVSSTTAYGYDTSGNITSKTVSGTNAGSLTTQYHRNSYGQITSVIDPRTLTTTIGYADAWSPSGGSCVPANESAYPTSITNPLNQTTNYTYNSCSGTVASVKDPNSATTSFSYDALGRVLCKTVKDASSALVAQTCDNFTDSAPASVTQTVTQSSTQNVVTETAFDGYGRVQETSLTSDPSGADLTDTTYDALGRVQSVSNPYRSLSDPTYGLTTYAYDALGRKIYECHPDNSSRGGTSCLPGSDYLAWSYANNVVTRQDEDGNQWQDTTDALGRLTKVMEPSGSSKSPSMETDYNYDALGDLTSVDQCGGPCPSSTAHVRSFTYSGLGQLITATNPETGEVCYGTWSGSTCVNGYDADGNLLYKTDARGVTVNYKYDNLNRISSKTYSNDSTGTPSSCFLYDSSSVTNGIGRLSNEWTQSSPTCGTSPPSSPFTGIYTETSITAYDGLGRIKNEQQCTPATCSSSSPYTPAYTYDFAGNLLTATNGTTAVPTIGTLQFSHTYDGANRLLTVTSNDTNHPPSLFSAQSPASNAVLCPGANTSSPYTASGSLMNATLGNGITVSRTYDVRLRVTCEIDGSTE